MIKNSRHQGAMGVASAIEYFTRKECPVFVPLFETQKYDLVVDIEGKLNKVECKHSTCKGTSGSYVVELRTKGGNQSWNKVVGLVDSADLLFILTAEGRYLIPGGKISKSKTINVGNKWSEYKL